MYHRVLVVSIMTDNKKIHCIGIGGIGLSGLAQILHEQGAEVSGSDIEDSFILENMRRNGIKVYIGHNESHITPDISRIIYSSAVPEDNIELKKARDLNIDIISFSEAVKEFTQNRYTIAVCGTHGKTTVTAFASLALMAGDLDPTVIIGSNLKEFSGHNFRTGKGKYFIVEACEYKRNFLHYSPDVIIITNIEAEHLDYFKDLEDYKEAYREFIKKLPEDGFVIANGDDQNVLDVIKDFKGNLILFSARDKNRDWYLNKNEIWKAGEKIGEISLSIPGEFNKTNALCAIILGQILKIDRDKIFEKFKEYNGAWRRFEDIGSFRGIKIISDYAHHPTAIKKTLKAAHEKYPDSKICCIFQPHQYNRTKNFLPEFAQSFKEAEFVIIPNIYKVRDTKEDTDSVSVKDLIEALEKNGKKVFNISDYEDIREFLVQQKANIDLVFIMGAGDIWKFGNFLLHGPPDICTVCED